MHRKQTHRQNKANAEAVASAESFQPTDYPQRANSTNSTSKKASVKRRKNQHPKDETSMENHAKECS